MTAARLIRLVTGGAITATLLVGAPAPALAHGDALLADEPIELAAGESVEFDGDLHYHRLVVRIEADRPVFVRFVRTPSGVPVVAAGPAERIALNELIRCCDDRPWASHTLVLTNPGGEPLTARLRAALVHDDLAVMVDGAESGTRGAVVVFGAIWVLVLRRQVRRRGPGVLRRLPAVGFAVITGVTALLASYGAARYGTGGAPALVASLSHVPTVPWNPIVSRSSLALAALMISWGWAGARWARFEREVAPVPWLGLGIALVGGVVATAAFVTAAYGDPVMPLATAVIAATPLLVIIAASFRRRDDRVPTATPV